MTTLISHQSRPAVISADLELLADYARSTAASLIAAMCCSSDGVTLYVPLVVDDKPVQAYVREFVAHPGGFFSLVLKGLSDDEDSENDFFLARVAFGEWTIDQVVYSYNVPEGEDSNGVEIMGIAPSV